MAEREGFEPSVQVSPHTRLAGNYPTFITTLFFSCFNNFNDLFGRFLAVWVPVDGKAANHAANFHESRWTETNTRHK